MAEKQGILLYAASEHDADMLYFAQIMVPDAFWAIGFEGKKYALLNPLEYSRVLKSGQFDVVWNTEVVYAEIKEKCGSSPQPICCCIFKKKIGIDHFVISDNFPAAIALQMIDADISFHCEETLFPERLIKTDEEAQKIAEGNGASAHGIARAKRKF